jgi:hypothetical protein
MKLTTAKLKQIIKEELDKVMNEEDDSPQAIATRIVNAMKRPEASDKSKSPDIYHAYYLLKQLSLDGDVNAARQYYQSIKQKDPTTATRILSVVGEKLAPHILKGA